MVDHFSGDKNDNTLGNLRIVTGRENVSLGWDKKKTSSNHRGVRWQSQSKKWQARIVIDKRTISLGLFNDELKAHEAYLEALDKYNKQEYGI